MVTYLKKKLDINKSIFLTVNLFFKVRGLGLPRSSKTCSVSFVVDFLRRKRRIGGGGRGFRWGEVGEKWGWEGVKRELGRR
jgi:hypothetical protein